MSSTRSELFTVEIQGTEQSATKSKALEFKCEDYKNNFETHF